MCIRDSDNSGTGVAFTRNPSNGNKELYGEYLMNAQGEDVVAGIRTPLPLNKNASEDGNSLEVNHPNAYKEIIEIGNKLEGHFKEVQDIEYAMEYGKVYLLQRGNGNKTVKECVKNAVDMVNGNDVTKCEELLMVDGNNITNQ